MESHKKVLIVDDEKNIRELLHYDFASSGFEVDSAENGIEGLQKFKKNDYDVIVTDLRMAGGGGFELLRNIRHAWPARKPVVIVITGFGDVTEQDAYEAGAEGFFVKPFRRRVIVNAANSLLEKPQVRLRKPPESILQSIKIHSESTLELFKKISLGRGGIFLPYQEPFPPVGSFIGFEFICKDMPEPLKGAGKVNWVRSSGQNNSSGIGLEFVFLTSYGYQILSERFNFQNQVAFIPKGK